MVSASGITTFWLILFWLASGSMENDRVRSSGEPGEPEESRESRESGEPEESDSLNRTELPVLIPSFFHQGLIYVQPVTSGGDTLRFFTDTADASVIYAESAERLGLTTTTAVMQGQAMPAAWLPPVSDQHYFPSPLLNDGLIPVRQNDRMPPHHRTLLEKDPSQIDGPRSFSRAPFGDGILGTTWFAGRSWHIDFANETLHLQRTINHLPAEEQDNDHKKSQESEDNISSNTDPLSSETMVMPESFVPLFFQEESGERRYHYARLEVVIASDTVSMVLKTGSHIELDEPSKEKLGHSGTIFPAGLISESLYKKWVDEHPEWPVYTNVDKWYGSNLIRVPSVRIGPHESAPVHFAVRRNEAFEEWFSRFTDQPVQGALGADAFHKTRITIDYPNGLLIFHEP